MEVKKIFQQQLEVFMKKNVDFLIAEASKDNLWPDETPFFNLLPSRCQHGVVVKSQGGAITFSFWDIFPSQTSASVDSIHQIQ